MTLSSSREVLQALLVEDDVEERWLLAEILRSRGHTVTVCQDAESALAEFRRSQHPLIVLDWVLPGMHGDGFCEELRRLPEGDRAVVLVVTGRDRPHQLEEILEAGADDYVSKPVDMALLNVRLAVAEREVRSVRERKRAEDALERTNRELQNLFQKLDEVFFSLDLSRGRLIQISPACKKVLGHSQKQLQENPSLWDGRLYPDSRERLLERLEELAPRDSLTLEYRVPDPSGPGRWVEASLKPERDSQGTVVRVDGILSDITERKESERELAQRNKELLTLHRISEITLTCSSLTQAYEEILGEVSHATGFPVVALETYDPDRERMVLTAARGIPLPEDGRPLEIPASETLTGRAVRTGRPVVERDARTCSEHTHPALEDLDLRTYLSFPMFVGGEVIGALTLAHLKVVSTPARLVRWAGSLANYLATFMDRLRAQDALRESEQRYRELTERLQQANQELETFTYSVSHDLRAPLRTMQGFAHTLLDRFGHEIPEEARGYLRRIIASGRQSEDLIRDLLAYGRLGFEEMDLSRVELDEVVSQAMEQMEADLKEAKARVEVEGNLPAVRGHRTTLVQVVTNLISNAVKFVPEGKRPRVRIVSRRRNGSVHLWVQDNGLGISQANRDRVFRAFERLTEGQEKPGTGIGLAIVRRGVERLGGRVGVESEPGEGSRFWIEIPAA